MSNILVIGANGQLGSDLVVELRNKFGEIKKAQSEFELKEYQERVDAYPTTERYDMVWVFLGDLPEEERPPLPVFDAWEKPGFRPLFGIFD